MIKYQLILNIISSQSIYLTIHINFYHYQYFKFQLFLKN